MKSFIPVYQREAVLAKGERFVGSTGAKTCVILALRHNKSVVLAHIDAMCVNAVSDMISMLGKGSLEVHVASLQFPGGGYSVWKHVLKDLKRLTRTNLKINVGHGSCLAICPKTGEVVREWESDVDEETSEKNRRNLQFQLTIFKKTPLFWVIFDGNKLKSTQPLPNSVLQQEKSKN